MKNDYFETKFLTVACSQADIDILKYAMSHVDWSDYDADDFGGESIDAACKHLKEIEWQLEEQYDNELVNKLNDDLSMILEEE